MPSMYIRILLLPISFLKQVVQLVVAAKDIAAFDQLNRARAPSMFYIHLI